MTTKRKIIVAVWIILLIGVVCILGPRLESTPAIVLLKPTYGGNYRCLLTADKTLEIINYGGNYKIEEPPIDKYIDYRIQYTLTEDEFDAIIDALEQIHKDGLEYQLPMMLFMWKYCTRASIMKPYSSTMEL